MDKRLHMLSDIAQFTFNWTYLGQQCRNVGYAGQTQGDIPLAWTDDLANDYANHLSNQYLSAYGGLTAKDATLDSVAWVWNEEAGVGPLHEGSNSDGLPVSGSEPHDGVAGSVSLAIKYGTGLGGRRNHGRFFFVGINAGLYDVDNPNVLKPGSVTDFNTANANWLLAFPRSVSVDLGDDIKQFLVVASFKTSPVGQLAGNVHPVTAVTLTDPIFDNQRRRLPGRGT